ncbi:MAG TPA: murein biosynthesis integral membrane protein MurJ [Actinomycetota bacterium]|nr:murein biosynthesis integral membrane protein MurJ [Actinomycetota bacterium]
MGKEVPPAPENVTPDDPDATGWGAPVGDAEDVSLVRSTAVMAVGTTLSRVTGFLRLAAMAFALGVAETRLADAYNVANNIPNIVYELVLGGVLTSVFVPVFVRQLKTRSREEAWEAARAVLTTALVVLLLIVIAGIVAAPWVVRLYTVRVPSPEREAVQELATLFLQFFMPQIVLYGLGAVATGLLNAHRRFAAPMFAPILNNLVVTATFLTFAFMPGAGAEAPSPEAITLAQKLVLGIGTTAGVAAMTLALWPSLRSIGFRLHWRFDPRNEAVRSLIRLSGWAVAYVVMNQIGLLIVIVLAGQDQGGYTAYQAAFIFFQLPHAIFSVSIMTALLPGLSEDWVRGDRRDFRADLARGVRTSAFVVIPAAAGYVVLAEPIVRLLLEHGVAGPESTRLVSGVLRTFALGLFQFSTFMLFLRAFYAMQDTRTPALINVFAVGLNTAANFALFPLLGVRGLALGHATAYTFAAIAAGVLLRRRLGGIEGRLLARGLAKIVAGAAVTAAAAWGVATLLERSVGVETLGKQVIQVGTSVLAGLIIFLGAALLLRMEELELVRRTITSRLRP